MAYDEALADRIRVLLADEPGITEQKMFGGLCIMVNGNMALGPVNDELMIRVAADAYEAILADGVAHEMTMGPNGRVMSGMVGVDNSVLVDDDALAEWVQLGVDYAASLPPKKKGKK